MITQEEIIEKYPTLFKEEINFECLDGWNTLIDVLCKKIEMDIKFHSEEYPNPVIVSQIKEKFGGLRFRVRGLSQNNRIYSYISFAETLSYRICEECSSQEDVTRREICGYLYTRCPKCMLKLGVII